MDQQVFNQTPGTSSTSEAIITSAPFVYAGFMRRFASVIVDAIFTGILGFILGFFTGRDMVISLSVGSIIGIIYTAVFDSSELMGTPGKAMLGIAVVSEKDQKRITFQASIVRFLCKYLSGAVFFIGYMIQPFTEKRQTFHDIVSNTVVIKKDPGQLNYWTAFKDNFNKILNN